MAESRNIHDDWRGEHLFVGNQLALDFLNTNLIANGETVELLPDPAAVARWMVHAGLLTQKSAQQLEPVWERSPRARREVLALRRFRDRLRAAVFAFEAGSSVSKEFLGELNALLRSHPMVRLVEADRHGGYQQTPTFDPKMPADLLGPLAEGTAALLIKAPAGRVHKCEGCPVHFLDVSKKGSRRWCSMNLCGNKVKVAAYQQRQREA